MPGERSEYLLAIDDPAALDRLCLGAKGNAAGGGRSALGEWLRVDGAFVDDPLVVDRAPAFMLRPRRRIHVEIVGQGTRPQGRADMHVPGERRRAAVAADLGSRERVGLVVGAKAAMLLRNRNAEQPRAMQIRIIVDRKSRVTVISGGAAREHGLSELARACDDPGLLVRQAESCGIKDRCIESDLVKRACAVANLYRHDAVTSVAPIVAFRN